MKLYNVIRIWLAIKFERLRPHLLSNKEQEKLKMLEFRSLALLFGFDISDMSDEEIIEGVTNAAKKISKVGLSASEAAEAFRRMALLV